MRRGKVYYAKLARGKAMFLAPRDDSAFPRGLGRAPRGRGAAPEPAARAILKVLRAEWEMAHRGPARRRPASRDRVVFTRAHRRTAGGDARRAERGAYAPKFTYIWTLAVGALPRCAAAPRGARDGAARDRALLPDDGRHDGARRAGARHRAVAARGRPRQPRPGRRGRRDDAGAGRLRAGAARRLDGA